MEEMEKVKADATEAGEELRRKGWSAVEQQRSSMASSISRIAGSLHRVADQFNSDGESTAAEYTHLVGRGLDKFSDRIREKDAGQLYRDVQDYARENPVIFMAGVIAVGFVATRFLRSSGPRAEYPPEPPESLH